SPRARWCAACPLWRETPVVSSSIVSLAALDQEALEVVEPAEDDLGSVTPHAGRRQDRLAGRGAERARVGLEAEVELPERRGATGLGGDVVCITAVADGRHSAVLADLLQVAPGAGAHHPPAWRGRRVSLGHRLQVVDQVRALPCVRHAGKGHGGPGDERLRTREPPG